MKNKTSTTIDNQKQQEAIINAINSFSKSVRHMSAKRRKELDDEIYETTRVTIDNLTSDDL